MRGVDFVMKRVSDVLEIATSDQERMLIEHPRLDTRDQISVAQAGASPHMQRTRLVLSSSRVLLLDLTSDDGISLRWAVRVSDFRSARASTHGVAVSAEVVYQIPCSEARVIQAICRMHRPYQSLGASAGRLRSARDDTL
mmetsp:Transcript_161778/g.514162  ORF Transcript_161778/g.514162 Transcript_161778/m.514162 type:complete len:140 (-) Transcript_161778:2-421(-)